jgi:Predicted sugar nucleotidyltransferases
MRAVILAAGRGNRLGSLTAERPKCLVELAGTSLLRRLLTALDAAGVAEVSIVAGYRHDLITRAAPECRIILNDRWATSSIAHSLHTAVRAGLLDTSDDTLIAYADIVVEPRVLAAIGDASPSNVRMLVNTDWYRLWSGRMPDPLADAERLILAPDGRVVAIGGRPLSLEQVQGQYMGLLRLDARGASALDEFYRQALARFPAADQWDITALLAAWIDTGEAVHTVAVHGGWLEIDTPDDLRYYERLHANGQLDALCTLDPPSPGEA